MSIEGLDFKNYKKINQSINQFLSIMLRNCKKKTSNQTIFKAIFKDYA